MAFRKFKVDCFHPNALQQIKDVVSGVEPKTTGLAGKYPDVNGFSSTALEQIKNAVYSATPGFDPSAGYSLFCIVVTEIDPEDPTNIEKAKYTYLGHMELSTANQWKVFTIDEMTATKMVTYYNLSGEEAFMSPAWVLLKDVPTDVWEQFTIGTEYTITDAADLFNYVVTYPAPGMSTFGMGYQYKIGNHTVGHPIWRGFVGDGPMRGNVIEIYMSQLYALAQGADETPAKVGYAWDILANDVVSDGKNCWSIGVEMPYIEINNE